MNAPTVEHTSTKMGMDGRAVKVLHLNAWICKCKCGAFRVEGRNEFFEYVRRTRLSLAESVCWTCRTFFKIAQIRGTYSADHKCGALCRHAKGSDCMCSCAGANHGQG